MSDQKNQITMRSGPITGLTYFIEKEEVTLGRDAANDLPIPDPEISRRHAHFLLKPEGVYIEDQGSTNGTFVNGSRIAAPHLLKHGDLITLAEKTVMSFEVKQQTTEPTPVAISSEPSSEAVYSPEMAEQETMVQPEPVYESVQAPLPQQPLAPAPEFTQPKKKMGWCLIVLIILLICVLIVGLVLTFMPASWWCALTFNQLPGCPIY